MNKFSLSNTRGAVSAPQLVAPLTPVYDKNIQSHEQVLSLHQGRHIHFYDSGLDFNIETEVICATRGAVRGHQPTSPLNLGH